MPFSKNEYAVLIARSWSDPSFVALMQNDPHAALREVGAQVAEGSSVKFVFNAKDTLHFVVPVRPDGVTDEDIEAAQNGGLELFEATPVAICTGPLSEHIC